MKIYAIKNPISNEVIYVGASIRPQERFTVHQNGAEWNPNTYRHKQIRLMKAANIKPIMEILCECEILETREKEEYYINYFISLGHNLTQKKTSGYHIDRVYAGELKRPSVC